METLGSQRNLSDEEYEAYQNESKEYLVRIKYTKYFTCFCVLDCV